MTGGTTGAFSASLRVRKWREEPIFHTASRSQEYIALDAVDFEYRLR
jgi:hypothetical protein